MARYRMTLVRVRDVDERRANPAVIVPQRSRMVCRKTIDHTAIEHNTPVITIAVGTDVADTSANSTAAATGNDPF